MISAGLSSQYPETGCCPARVSFSTIWQAEKFNRGSYRDRYLSVPGFFSLAERDRFNSILIE
jgi:hypothetical protein